MKRSRRTFNAGFKAKVAIEAIKEEKTISELAQIHQVHQNLIGLWKKEFLSNAGKVFAVHTDEEEEITRLQALATGNMTSAGKAYFITDGVSSNFFKFFDTIVEGAGYRIRPKNLWISKKITYSIGAFTEFMALLARPFVRYNPKFSRFAVMYTCADFTFKPEKAQKDFGFCPKYSHEEAFEMTVKYYRESISHQQFQNG